ncbi:hypothetical protein PMI42_04428 [Bradyrhizobium sp. YR681]|uniref:hypothetical protein n=1 Tax=Bradyrhizobium sp. YR681 TaxID=1144344 RepID=UPI00027139CB|nr:hypothetical protein [Bradyrhizobium sp. YR681]EJN12297.1 hypothetical protein PMI42_04428 [Bradyrhizobium sp. YR681]
MLKRYLTLTLTAAAILAAPAAFAASGQTRAGVAAKTTKQASVRQAYGAVPTSAATNSGEGTAIARPPAQPGAW